MYLGDDMPDPGLVLTGTKCGENMVKRVNQTHTCSDYVHVDHVELCCYVVSRVL